MVRACFDSLHACFWKRVDFGEDTLLSSLVGTLQAGVPAHLALGTLEADLGPVYAATCSDQVLPFWSSSDCQSSTGGPEAVVAEEADPSILSEAVAEDYGLKQRLFEQPGSFQILRRRRALQAGGYWPEPFRLFL